MPDTYAVLRAARGAVFVLAPAVASAQVLSVRPGSFSAPRHWVGADFTVAQPLAEFGHIIGSGFGGSANYIFKVDRQGIFGLRVDGSFLNYGNETQRVCFNFQTCRVQLDVHTSNNIATFGVGAQLTAPSGPVRPYVAGSVGYSYFFTESSVDGTDDYDRPVASTENYHDGGTEFTGMAGVLIPVSAGRVPVSIDFGARYHGNGERSYLTKGSIHDNGPGIPPTISAIRTDANFITYHVGVSIGLRSSSRDDRR